MKNGRKPIDTEICWLKSMYVSGLSRNLSPTLNLQNNCDITYNSQIPSKPANEVTAWCWQK